MQVFGVGCVRARKLWGAYAEEVQVGLTRFLGVVFLELDVALGEYILQSFVEAWLVERNYAILQV